MSFEKALLKRIVEGALLAAAEPLNRERLLSLFPEDELQPEKEELQAALEELQAETQDRGYELTEVASGWRFTVKQEVAPWVNRLWDEKPQKYSRAMLETLSLIAYRQPITRGDIEEIRGVAVSSHIIKTLLEREWVKVVGHRDVPGRPSLFATTRQFLDYFNLKSLDMLPSLGDIRDLDKLNAELDFEAEKTLVAQGVNLDAEPLDDLLGDADSDSEPSSDDAQKHEGVVTEDLETVEEQESDVVVASLFANGNDQNATEHNSLDDEKDSPKTHH
jgi:segregation and condensation protein B